MSDLFAPILAAVVALVLAYVLVVAPLDRASCHQTGEVAGVEVEWRFLTGCYLEHDGRLVPKDRWVHITGGDE